MEYSPSIHRYRSTKQDKDGYVVPVFNRFWPYLLIFLKGIYVLIEFVQYKESIWHKASFEAWEDIGAFEGW